MQIKPPKKYAFFPRPENIYHLRDRPKNVCVQRDKEKGHKISCCMKMLASRNTIHSSHLFYPAR